MNKEIVVVQAGWVFLGNVVETEYGLQILEGSVIRQWGTTKGLGELAIHGPTKKTILDPAGEIRVPTSAVLARFICQY